MRALHVCRQCERQEARRVVEGGKERACWDGAVGLFEEGHLARSDMYRPLLLILLYLPLLHPSCGKG